MPLVSFTTENEKGVRIRPASPQALKARAAEVLSLYPDAPYSAQLTAAIGSVAAELLNDLRD